MKPSKEFKARKFLTKAISRSGIGILDRGSVYSRTYNGVGWSCSGFKSWSKSHSRWYSRSYAWSYNPTRIGTSTIQDNS